MDSPLVVFVNTKSGGLQGAKILSKFRKCVPFENVFDLAQGGPLPGLQKFSGQKYRIIVCGGDGSVGWVLTEIDKLKLSRDLTPPVAILPIGTGNDLSRVLKWGGSHSGKKLKSVVGKIERSCVVLLDKWRVNYVGEEGGAAMPHTHHSMHNYFSVGADAHIALQFHELRLAHPEKFSSRTQNLAWYVRLGLQNRSPELISSYVCVEINGKKVELPDQTRCVVVLNLPSYSGGGNPWGTKKSTRHKFSHPAIDDGLLEVVAVNGPLQLVGIHANIIRGKRLGQGNSIRITTTKPMAAQVDGEPWSQPPSTTTINYAGKSRMLANSLPTTIPSSSSTSTTATATGHKIPTSPSMLTLKEEKDKATSVARSMSSHTLLRTRSSTSPIQHTPSPIKYGPVLPAKRRKNRQYCEACGLEFYLPYMLANHHNSGLCTNGGSSSVKMPSTPPPTLSIQIGDGASTQDPTSSQDVSDDEGWRNQSGDVKRKESEVESLEQAQKEEEPIKSEPKQEIPSNPESPQPQPEQTESPSSEVVKEDEPQPEPKLESQPELKEESTTQQPEPQQPEIKKEDEVKAEVEVESQEEPNHNDKQTEIEGEPTSVPVPESSPSSPTDSIPSDPVIDQTPSSSSSSESTPSSPAEPVVEDVKKEDETVKEEAGKEDGNEL